MKRFHYAAIAALVSAVGLLFTAHPAFWFALIVSSMYAGYAGMQARFGETAEV